jgi:hypothetical protein
MFILCFLREKTESIDAPIDKYYCVYGSVFDHTTNDYMVLRMVLGKPLRVPTIFGVLEMKYHKNPDEDTQALVNGASHWNGYNKIYLATKSLASPEFLIVLFHIICVTRNLN